MHKKYTERFEGKAHKGLINSLPFGEGIGGLLDEYEKKETKEAKLTKDADNMELLLSLKEQMDIGNERARTWIPSLLKRLKTKEARTLAHAIVETDSDRWWFGDKNDEWWVRRNEKN